MVDLRIFRRKLFSLKDRRTSDISAESASAASENVQRRVERSKSLGTNFTSVPSVNGEAGPATTSPDHRRTPSTPANSSVSLPTHSKSHTPDRKDDPHGLNLIHSPDGDFSADIIFIHGLGGSSRLTWCKNHDLNLFWPARWLPKDRDISQARIFTFGYNADFRSSPQSSMLGITDFAKNLLFDMRYGRNQDGQNLGLGQVPIVFVVHSMGGLVFKKAYLEAQFDNRYKTIIQSTKAVIFLATPHRGSDLSEFLNKLLSASFRNSAKHYISELGKQGSFIKTTNEQFRHLAARLQIFSFYETLRTPIGIGSAMILDEESAKLGYPGEISRSLNADHHGVCKFETPDDSNYKVILGAIKSLVSSQSKPSIEATVEEIDKLRALLSVSDNPEHDLSHFWSRRTEGTCDWVLEQPEVHRWSSLSSVSEVLWFYGRPARGKSVLSSFLIHSLREKGASVQYFFFRNGDETKRSITSLLKSLAFQVASQLPAFRKTLLSLADSGYKPKETDWKSTWKKLFLNSLFKMESQPPFFWVIDGLDECSSGQQVLELLADINSSVTPIRVLVTSRFNPGLFASFGRTSTRVSSSSLSLDKDITDIRIYVEDELQYLGWDNDVKEEVMARVLDQANDNFLWVHLILEEIKECHTDDDVRAALVELPPGMESLYERMEESISRIRRPSEKSLARQLLLWAIYARRSITMDELSAVLEPDYGHILDMASTINRLCGHFLVIENGNQIGLLHQTAREYLVNTKNLPFSLSSSDAHNELFQKSISAFMDRGYRHRLQTEGPKFLQYRATSWTHHLRHIGHSTSSDDILDILLRFFKEQSVLTWIQALAELGQLKILIETSHCLTSFVKRKRNTDAARVPSLRRFEDLEFLELWSRDLLKLPGRFGSNLSQDPKCIHSCIAPFCPQTSAMYRTFGHSSKSPSVRGLPDDWDDCLARVSVGSEHRASLLSCSWRYLAVVTDVGAILIWDCTTFHRVLTLEHGEIVSAVCFSANGDRVATYGSRTTKALCLEFVENDTALMVGSDRRCVLQASLGEGHINWTVIDLSPLNDVESIEGTYLNSPSDVAISPDHSKIAAAYRRFPLTIWSLSPVKILKRFKRELRRGGPASISPFVERISWHPNSEELIGIFVDGYYFKLNIIDGTYQEQAPEAGQWPTDIKFSPDGTVFAVCGVHGTIKLFDYQTTTLIYQLTSEDTITDFCFSQDGRRFYDIRGSSCNVWEPNALIRLSAGDDNPASSHSPDESIEHSTYPSESFADNPTPIVLVAPMPGKPVVVWGDDEGLVTLLDYDSNQKLQIDRTATEMGIEHLVWSDDRHHFVYAEVGGRLTLVRVEATPKGWKHHRVARFKPKREIGGIMQLLLAADSKSLLVVFQHSVQVWSLEPVLLREHRVSTPTSVSSKWIIHPLSPQHMLAITPSNCIVRDWVKIDELARHHIRENRPEDTKEINSDALNSYREFDDSSKVPDSVVETVERVLATHLKGRILITISRKTATRSLRPRFILVDILTEFDTIENGSAVRSVPIPPQVTGTMELPLNVLKNEHLVFLDSSYRVCTWHLKAARGAEIVKRHFFIPRDWVSDQGLGQLFVTSSGSIICPRQGGITVIDSAIGSLW
ncbi:hypothetical protein F5X96DRAFT_672759 [Biscogniauxia mediterranea]|nr:hypothetical protein F5X96DRAFT_672759 [Biscogniauxia mediterranea]